MAETITIINNSGKIISTGKQLLGIFKDARAAYQEKKASIKGGPIPGIRRAQTFDVGSREAGAHYQPGYPPTLYDDQVYDYGYGDYPPSQYHAAPRQLQHHDEPRQLQYDQRRYIEAPASSHGGRAHRRRSVDDLDRRSQASSHRSYRSHRSSRTAGDGASQASRSTRPPLTASNLRTLSEVSSTTPSAAPRAYRSPYAETAPRDMMLSRPTLTPAATMPAKGYEAAPSMVLPVRGGPPMPPGALAHRPGGQADIYHAGAPPTEVSGSTFVPDAHQQQPPMQVTRPRSDPSLRKRKSIDLNLAYGSMPPDLESRTDLDPRQDPDSLEKEEDQKSPEDEARGLMERIEGMLVEAECLQHSATAIIAKLQSNPEAAAAVALTLAELSALLSKMSPAFLGIVKGGAPAVFALLASPQFLIAAGAAVGVTVVMFGGWKIVKRIQQQQQKQAIALEAQQPQAPAIEMNNVQPAADYAPAPGAQYPPTEYGAPAHPHDLGAPAGQGHGYGEPHPHQPQEHQYPRGGPGSATFDEALVVEEELSSIETWRRGIAVFGEDESVDMELISPEALRSTIEDDAMSRRTGRSHRSHRSHRSSHRSRHRDGGSSSTGRRHREGGGNGDEGSDNNEDHEDGDDDRHGDVPERRSSRGFRDRDEGETESRSGASTSGSSRHHHHRRHRSRDRERDRDRDDDRSESGSSHRSSRSRRTVRAIEDGNQDQENPLDSMLRPKEKKSNMLKSLFKRKERERSEISVLV